ncbi:centromere binding protein B [Coprinopsis cinerea okayama7|uniref:Centromere binding protein B n=1 Tax=Coprinopsis cinerea (strain Okayama-7 / 130 / ATCC MYA-4618 / FGSC 9003) TaxID=240176 RepID=A8NQU1_COPC7|nr:centromere binding protein B [Coprinopsis cinerea okayama7\|eukprot:XP_001835682.2 centromere binding protein B [Coprinopsis cinerea okayama7\
MDVHTDDNFACYRSDYRQPDRCVSTSGQTQSVASLPACDDTWIYPNYTVPQAFTGRNQMAPMYTTQRHPDQSYPSPSPSVPSPGPRVSPTLDLSSQTLGGLSGDNLSAEFCTRDSSLGPVRTSRSRQAATTYRLSRRTSISDPQLSLDTPESRPSTPADDPSDLVPEQGLSLNINGSCPLQYQPATPTSLCSPYMTPYSEYPQNRPPSGHIDGRPPSPSLTSRSYMASGPSSPTAAYFPDVSPAATYHRNTRMRKHTKKKLDSLEKKRICLYHLDHQNARQEDIAEMFGIERSTVSKILKHKNQWLNVDDNAEAHAKNRPSKFPELEAVMRDFLQEALDKDIPLSDSLIRTRALEIAKGLGISEEKFKASSGWVENFKHRHGIRSGKWTGGVKHVPAFDNPNPGLYGHTAMASRTYQPQLQMDSEDSTSGSPNRESSPELDDDTGDHGRTRPQPLHRPEDQDDSQWASSSSQRLSLSSAAVLPSPLSASSTNSADDGQSPQQCLPGGVDPNSSVVDMHASSTTYLPPESIPYAISTERRIPTLQEAEDAINILIAYIDSNPDRILEHSERTTLTTIKCALFQYASGVPFDRR